MALVIVGTTLDRSHIQVPVVNRHAVDKDRFSRTSLVAPLIRLFAIVDAKLEVAIVRLAANHSRMVDEAEIKSPAGFRIVFGDQITRVVIHFLRSMHPQRN